MRTRSDSESRGSLSRKTEARPETSSVLRPPLVGGVVSVLMTAHGTDRWIDEAVESVLSQSLPPGWQVELCIGVDGDPDCLRRALIYAVDPRVRVFEFGDSRGTYATLNSLIDLSTGELIAVLDSDDLAKPDRLLRQIHAFMADQSIDFVAGAHDSIDEQGNDLPNGAGSLVARPTIAKLCFPLHSTWCARRTVFETLRGYAPWKCGADTEFWIRALASGVRALVINSPLSSHRKRPGQLTDPQSPTGVHSSFRKQAQEHVTRDIDLYRRGVTPVHAHAVSKNNLARSHGAPLRVAVLMPSIPSREHTARNVVENLLSQEVSQITVHLNGYSEIPSWAKDPRILAVLNPPGTGPLVRWSQVPIADYVLGVDDDLIYPKDYIHKMVSHLRALGRGSAISMHATHWPAGKSDLESRVILPFAAASASYVAKTYIGCGASAFHGSDLLRVDRAPKTPRLFERMDDVWMSAAVARASLKIYRPPSSLRWIESFPEQFEGIFSHEKQEKFATRKRAIAEAMKLGGWRLTPTHNDIRASDR